jgi:hypothetical protein
MQKLLLKVCGFSLLAIGASSILGATAVPEIDPGSGANAIALLSGVLLLARAVRRK